MYKLELSRLKELFESGLYSPTFYKSRVNSEQLECYEEFQNIPFMFKNDLRKTSAMERTAESVEEIYGFFSSSGTTGSKTFYVYSNEDKKVHSEFVKVFFDELGINNKDIGAIMAPIDTGVMAHTMIWQFNTIGAAYINCPMPTPSAMIETVKEVPVTVIATRPSVVSSIMYDKEKIEKARKSNVQKLILGGGYLSEERRKLLEDIWNAPCYNLLGTSEMFGPMASECREKDGMHYLDKYLLIEVLDSHTKKPVKQGEEGIAVYTTLWKKGFPLLRYWTDDVISLRTESCGCGRHLPRIIHRGRLIDSLVAYDKRIFPIDVENMIFRYGAVGEWKIQIENDNAILFTETINDYDKSRLCNALGEYINKKVSIESVAPFALNYDGHAKRFNIISE